MSTKNTSTLRIHDNGKVRELIPKDKLEVLERFVSSDKTMDTDGLWILQCINDKEYFVNKFWRWLVNQALETLRLRKQVELYEESSLLVVKLLLQ